MMKLVTLSSLSYFNSIDYVECHTHHWTYWGKHFSVNSYSFSPIKYEYLGGLNLLLLIIDLYHLNESKGIEIVLCYSTTVTFSFFRFRSYVTYEYTIKFHHYEFYYVSGLWRQTLSYFANWVLFEVFTSTENIGLVQLSQF